MKKFMSYLLAISMVASLSGCKAKVSNAPAAPQGNDKKVEEKQKITLWHIQTNKISGPIFDAAVDRFRKDHPNVTVEVVAAENDPYKTKLKVAMGSGDAPDVFHSWGGGWLEAFVKEGMVMDITAELDKNKWRNNFYPAALSMTKFNGKDYGVGYDIGVVPVFYNKDLFKKYNVEVPKTYSDFLKAVKTFKDNKIIPLSIANQTKWPGALIFVYFANRLGGEQLFLDALGRKNGASFADPAFVEAGKKLQELVDMGAFPDGFNGMNYDTGASRILMYSDKAAMQIQTSGFYSVVKGEAADFFKDKLDFFPFPSVEGGKGDPSNVVGGINALSVYSKTKYKDSSIELVKYLTNKDFAEDWVKKAGRIAPINGVTSEDPGQQKLSQMLSKAKYLQGYFDQFLPPELGELHKDTTQAIFGKTMTPEEAAKKMEDKAKETIK
jgi:raffinose/stachyose/melibiose transport system substrate-binding protein